MKRSNLLWPIPVLLAFAALLFGIPAASASSAASSTGYITLGNLSQSPSPVDIYLYRSGDSSPSFVQHDVAYGTLLPAQGVSAGGYSVKMRTAGSSASSSPAWSVNLTVQAGGSYTVAPLRTSSQGGKLQVIDNNLTTPKGKSLVRVIQADLNQKQLTFHCSCASGSKGNIVTDAAPGTVSPQTPIPPGPWTMTATGSSTATTMASRYVPLAAGTVHTEVVIASANGGVQIEDLVNAAGAGQVPSGGVSTGFGGTAPRSPGSPLPWLAIIGGGGLLVLTGGLGLRRGWRRRLTTGS
jgi:hypothetical protein